jgi:hypothetical protein
MRRSHGVEDLLDTLAAAGQLLVAAFLDIFAVGAYLWRPLQGLTIGVRHFLRFPFVGSGPMPELLC